MLCKLGEDNICVYCKQHHARPAYSRMCVAEPELTQEDAEIFSGFAIRSGPGTELHAVLGRFGLTASGDCKCRSRAAYMDQQGCDWCEANIDEIVGWLRESAAERGLPFLDAVGRVLVRLAIRNARRQEAARGTKDRPPLHAQR